jgi:hypothetical protein
MTAGLAATCAGTYMFISILVGLGPSPKSATLTRAPYADVNIETAAKYRKANEDNMSARNGFPENNLCGRITVVVRFVTLMVIAGLILVFKGVANLPRSTVRLPDVWIRQFGNSAQGLDEKGWVYVYK